MSEKTISIDPITRLEGHGKIQIFLDDDGFPQDAVLQVPELRGFEEFCKGRRAEDMPRITERICGVCPEAHHFASTKALDNAFSVAPPHVALNLRKLLYNSYIFADHLLHLFYLSGPDFFVDDGRKENRNIVGIMNSLGEDIGQAVIKTRRLAHEAIEIIGGHQVHPVTGIPGGLSDGVTDADKQELEEIAKEALSFAKQSLDLFHCKVLDTDKFGQLLNNPKLALNTYYMGLVDEREHVTFYDGKIKIVDPQGKEFAKVTHEQITEMIRERVEPWTYVKFPYLKEIGWNDFTPGPDSGIFRVGPLARLNVSDGMKTELAQKEYDKFVNFFGDFPVHSTYAYHWARLIELIQAAESMVKLSHDKNLTDGPIRAELGEPTEGVGVIEAARGTLIHSYDLNEDGIVIGANMIVPTTSNSAALSISIRESALDAIKNGETDEKVLNKVEMGFRPYDPCLACSTHSITGGMDLGVELFDNQGTLIKELTR